MTRRDTGGPGKGHVNPRGIDFRNHISDLIYRICANHPSDFKEGMEGSTPPAPLSSSEPANAAGSGCTKGGDKGGGKTKTNGPTTGNKGMEKGKSKKGVEKGTKGKDMETDGT